jgi:hypothetical protein
MAGLRAEAARSISDCGCSMRKPIENGLASNTPRSCSIAKVSRALWPSASTTWSARSCSPLAGQHHARTWPRVPSPRSAGRRRAAEADLAAQRFDRRAHLLHHRHQPEGADVRLGDVQDLLRRAGLDELVSTLRP